MIEVIVRGIQHCPDVHVYTWVEYIHGVEITKVGQKLKIYDTENSKQNFFERLTVTLYVRLNVIYIPQKL